MATTVNSLSEERTAVLLHAYREAVRIQRRRFYVGAGLTAALTALASRVAEVEPARFFGNIDRFTDYIARLFVLDTGAAVLSDPAEWFWGLDKWLALLGETILIAYVGTVLGAIGAFALCFAASRNVTRSPVVVWCARRFLEFARTVPEIVFALIFVVAFGLGPLPGVLAIAIHTMGALGKLFAEVVENIDMKPVEGIAAVGGTWFARVRFGALPQVMSNFVSYALLRFEINVRGAAVMGFVGAGGIGQTLISSIRKFYYSDISAILLLIIATVMVIDHATEALRHRLLGAEGWS
jgi:phosphonate transport system permease protein